MDDETANTQLNIFDAFFTSGANIEQYLQLVIPIIVRTYERPEVPAALCTRQSKHSRA